MNANNTHNDRSKITDESATDTIEDNDDRVHSGDIRSLNEMRTRGRHSIRD